MTDIVSKEKRSSMMAGIRGRDTKPELLIRKAIFARGFRFKLQDKSLPGKPDLVFPKYKAVIQVNGCFWHGHDCPIFRLPKTRRDFWQEKITGNQLRDKRNIELLKGAGWRILTVWECALKGQNKLPLGVTVDLIENWLLAGDETSVEIRGV
ncbi:DNA mismatch endonuclease Vsr [uncultured Endozoicomonas sp.]|uniref:very short patch repair endonuclease n=1 Tax=uncultured Endozoicomonas sp. TaxID=432652 RepID=UPI002620A65D|nr:DNA mismatch endonuclease Vsr [uncultured Endozoicomonas sp.]